MCIRDSFRATASLSFTLQADGISLLFDLIATAAWLGAGIFAMRYMDHAVSYTHLVIVWIFMWIASPVATHLIARMEALLIGRLPDGRDRGEAQDL